MQPRYQPAYESWKCRDNGSRPDNNRKQRLPESPEGAVVQLVVKINGNELSGKYYFSFSQVPHALLTRFRYNPLFSKVRRRCGRGRHGRPWPCEWDVGREPDRDERSEPPTATPPTGLVKKQCKRLPPLHSKRLRSYVLQHKPRKLFV